MQACRPPPPTTPHARTHAQPQPRTPLATLFSQVFVVNDIVDWGMNIVVSDIDVVWLKDPMELFGMFGDAGGWEGVGGWGGGGWGGGGRGGVGGGGGVCVCLGRWVRVHPLMGIRSHNTRSHNTHVLFGTHVS